MSRGRSLKCRVDRRTVRPDGTGLTRRPRLRPRLTPRYATSSLPVRAHRPSPALGQSPSNQSDVGSRWRRAVRSTLARARKALVVDLVANDVARPAGCALKSAVTWRFAGVARTDPGSWASVIVWNRRERTARQPTRGRHRYLVTDDSHVEESRFNAQSHH